MKTLEYLKSHSLDELCKDFAITARRHGNYPNLVQLKYSQIDSPMGDPIVQECRGLILDEADGWRVVCHSTKTQAQATAERKARLAKKENR